MNLRNYFAGAAAMAAASALRVTVQIAILPIIGRVLGPHAYGEIALVSPFIFFSMLLAESGLGVCIVRTETVTSELEGTIFCFSAGFSLIVIAVFAALAYPLGRFLDEPRFPSLLMAMSSILLLASFNIVPAALLLRAKKYEWIAFSEVASSIGGVCAVLLGILLGWGVWSLVAQQIAFWLCKVCVVVLGSRYRPNLLFRWSIIKQYIYFGSNLTGASILSFVARNIDNILIGKFMGSEILGFYALAFQIIGLPSMVLGGSVYYTVFVGTSEANRTGQSSKGHFLKMFRVSLLISAPVMVGLAVTAPLSVPLFLGERWFPAARLLLFLAPLGLCLSMGAAMSGVLIGMGRTDIAFRLTIISSIATVIAILCGVFISSGAVAIGVSIAALPGYFLCLRAIMKLCSISLKEVMRATVAPLIAALIMGCAVFVIMPIMPTGLLLISRLFLSIVMGMAIYGLVLFVGFREQMAVDIADLKMIIFKRPTKPM